MEPRSSQFPDGPNLEFPSSTGTGLEISSGTGSDLNGPVSSYKFRYLVLWQSLHKAAFPKFHCPARETQTAASRYQESSRFHESEISEY